MSDFVTRKEFETWKQTFEKRLLSVMSCIQCGVASVPAAGSVAVTFPFKFTSAPPAIAISIETTNQNFKAWIHSITATGFSILGENSTSGISCNVRWIAKL